MPHIFMKRPSIRIAFVIIALAAAAAVVIGDLAHHAAGRKLREAILAELQPVALKNCTLKRFGSANDGGYLMCENLIEPLAAAYSYGVGGNDDWGCEMSRRYNVPVEQYDVIPRSEEHTSELQSRFDLVCRLLLEKKKIFYPAANEVDRFVHL